MFCPQTNEFLLIVGRQIVNKQSKKCVKLMTAVIKLHLI